MINEPRPKLLSVIVPCFNEGPVIEMTQARLLEVLRHIPDLDFELIFVDDGSGDETLQRLRRGLREDHRIRILSFSRNFGHQAAITAGLEHCSGDAAVLIDADLQDPPEVIEQMVAAWRQGADVAYGTRTERQGETKMKTSTAKGFYRLLNRLSDVAIPVDTGDFRLMDRKVIEAFLRMPEQHRFIRGMVSWLGFNQVSVPYERAPRVAGTTKYPMRKMVQFALDGIVSFSRVPLKLVTWIGFVSSLMALFGIVTALLVRVFTNSWVPGWAAIFIGILFMGGVQLISIGVIGEYVGRIYSEVKKRPLYLVKDRIGFVQNLTAKDPSIEEQYQLPR